MDNELSNVFLTNAPKSVETAKRSTSRDCSTGRCLTNSTEMERLKQKQENTEMELERNKRRLEERQKLCIEKEIFFFFFFFPQTLNIIFQ